MINRQVLLSDLQQLLQRLEADLLERSESDEVPEVGKTLRAEYDRAKTAERTAQNYEDWRTDAITQAAAAWVLSCVFVRFLEDNGLINPPNIAGPNDRLGRARDEHELYFRNHPRQTDRDYLLAVFDQLAKLPGTKDVFGEHNPFRELPSWLSGDAAGELLGFFQKIDANSGALIHDFTDTTWDTRFLGDLYQDLSEAARKKYALLQTPEFVEEFILDRTLNPALDEFGLDAAPVLDNDGKPITESGFRMIDPACGSGHFLLGAFPRILNRWQRREPGTNVRELVQRALDSIHGVDVNPYAVAIARFRLLLAAMRASGVTKLADAPGFRLNLACGDSLLHTPLKTGHRVFDFELTNGDAECEHVYQSEDLPILKRMLRGGQFHAVVANPPYITPKDRQLNDRYRKRFKSCHMKYSLAVPFLERIFRLAVDGGFTGQITANSFMKREFGKKLIESFIPTVDLTHVIDTSVACIPGHNTPTVILLGRNRAPVSTALRTVLGIKGETGTPINPETGKAWLAILDQVDQPGTQSEFITVNDTPRVLFHKHPWAIGGGGAAELKEQFDDSSECRLAQYVASIGPASFAGVDDMFFSTDSALRRKGCQASLIRPLILGDTVRDWCTICREAALVPYDACHELVPYSSNSAWGRYLWSIRRHSQGMLSFGGKTREMLGEKWWSWYRWISDRYRVLRSIVYTEVASNNHFVLDRGGSAFSQTSPVIKLLDNVSDDAHLGLLGILNSSSACFWMKQVTQPKTQTTGMDFEAWQVRRAFNASMLQHLPVPEKQPVLRARQLDSIAQLYRQSLPDQITPPSASEFQIMKRRAQDFRAQMISLQEELDWECYRHYGLFTYDLSHQAPPGLALGERAFEIVLARNIIRGKVQTTWFERHGATRITELPSHWPDDYRRLVEDRIRLIESDVSIRVIEQPEYKRRWDTASWDSQKDNFIRQWLLDRMETYFDFDGRMNNAAHPTSSFDISLVSIAQLADVARQDHEYLQAGELYRDDAAFDVQGLVAELVEGESVPLLPILRYKPGGLRKRAEWEQTWELQRREDAIDTRTTLAATDSEYLTKEAAETLKRTEVGSIPVPPRYTSVDFLRGDVWGLRGKLDVPKERWISFPHCEGPDGTLVLCWAGYDHLQQARAISAYYVRVQTEFGGTDDARLIPLLACLIELLPWLKQWHNEPDAAFDGMRMGDYFEGFVNEEARQLNKTIPEIKAWTPPARPSGRRRRTRS